jgi:hypothetical protein
MLLVILAICGLSGWSAAQSDAVSCGTFIARRVGDSESRPIEVFVDRKGLVSLGGRLGEVSPRWPGVLGGVAVDEVRTLRASILREVRLVKAAEIERASFIRSFGEIKVERILDTSWSAQFFAGVHESDLKGYFAIHLNETAYLQRTGHVWSPDCHTCILFLSVEDAEKLASILQKTDAARVDAERAWQENERRIAKATDRARRAESGKPTDGAPPSMRTPAESRPIPAASKPTKFTHRVVPSDRRSSTLRTKPDPLAAVVAELADGHHVAVLAYRSESGTRYTFVETEFDGDRKQGWIPASEVAAR